MSIDDIEKLILSNEIDSLNFDRVALSVFNFQYNHCPIYRAFVNQLKIQPESISSVTDIPFLPISFFKSHSVISLPNDVIEDDIDLYFLSSGTTSDESSKHKIFKPKVYENNLKHNFSEFYGDPSQYIFIGLLPSYLEKGHSSLVYMCHKLMAMSRQKEEYFFLHDYIALKELLINWPYEKPAFIIGVTYALLDFADAFPIDISKHIVMETGGMKGKKKEMTRNEVHMQLCGKFNVNQIHSEYGMTELLSQSYSSQNGIFLTPSTQNLYVRDVHDPMMISSSGTGLANVIDLANIYSCSFIATDDIAKIYDNKSFEILGRTDHSALRGCSLLSIK